MAEAFGTAGLFVVEEVSGEQRRMSLGGRALPYRPIRFSGRQRIVKTWYPGNPVATVQVLGADEGDTTIRGMWKNRFLGFVTFEGSLVAKPDAAVSFVGIRLETATEVVEAVDDIRRKGSLLRISWGPEVRYGFIEEFSKEWDREQDVAWEIKFSWISIGDPNSQYSLPSSTNYSDLTAELIARRAELADAQDSSFLSQLAQVTDKINSNISKVNTAIDDAINSVNGTAQTILGPVDAARRLGHIYSRTIEEVNNLLDSLNNRITWGFSSSQPGDFGQPSGLPDVETLPLGKRIQADIFQRSLRLAARKTQAEAANQAATVAKQVEPDLVAVFVARQAMDLRQVSTRFYKTPNEWARLALFNGIKGSALTAGQVVFVPSLRALPIVSSGATLAPTPIDRSVQQ